MDSFSLHEFVMYLSERFNAFWDQFSNTEKMIISVTVLAILLAIAYYVINWLRGLAYEEADNPDVFLTDFQQLKAEGKLSEDEFSKVKNSAIHATVNVLASAVPDGLSQQPVSKNDSTDATDPKVPKITPNPAPPITLAEALARKNADANNFPVEEPKSN